MHNMFGLGRGGLPGNDDSGGLSSWYVWASLGLFPVAGQSLYLVNAPSFAQSRLRPRAARSWRSSTDGFVEPEPDGPAQYVQSVTFNGEPLERSWLTARELHRGGQLRSSARPRAVGLGHRDRPPSVSPASRVIRSSRPACRQHRRPSARSRRLQHRPDAIREETAWAEPHVDPQLADAGPPAAGWSSSSAPTR